MNDHVVASTDCVSINPGLALCPFFRKAIWRKVLYLPKSLLKRLVVRKEERKRKRKEVRNKEGRKGKKKKKGRKACDPEETTLLRVSWANSEAYSLAPSNKPLKS